MTNFNQRKLIVGIDFGTTYTGVAWAETRRADDIHVIDTWPSRLGSNEGESSVKVPTQLRYTSQGTEWGFQIPPTAERNHWFKLGLQEDKTSAPGEKSADELTTDYLAEIYKHILYTLEQKIGAVSLRTIPIEFCLTVPAIWSEAAKERTLAACQKAGLKSASEITLASEPEAAAISALHGLDPHGLKVGDCFVVCDAGGGTVDLISYRIKSLHPRLQVEEMTAGTGGLCGSVFLNRRFIDFITRKLGGLQEWDEDVLSEASERFNTVIKHQYLPSRDGDDGYPVPVPGLANNEQLGIRRGKFTISKNDMHDIFEPVILKIIGFVQDQIRSSKAKSVLLVGGFGQNTYLKERLREALPKIQVLQPPNAWTAIVRGAVMMGLSNANTFLSVVQVVSRRARKHYGMIMNIDYNRDIHDRDERFWCTFRGRYKVEVMEWFIRKGDVVEEEKPKTVKFNQKFPVSEGRPQSYAINVYADSQSSVAPVHPTDNVKKLVTLTIDLSSISRSQWKKMVQTGNDKKEYYVVHGSVKVTFGSASTTYKLSCEWGLNATVKAEYA